jgi:redox-sensitive bicupin YhaK (pirin superfamily)
MPINTDAFIYAGLFAPGDRAEHNLGPKRGAWVQVVRGKLEIGEIVLETGDGAAISAAESLPFRFEEPSEVILFDLGMEAPLIWR